MANYSWRIEDAAEALCRYAGQPIYEEFAELLDELAELNDDLYHMRAPEVIEAQACKVTAAFDAIMRRARANQAEDDALVRIRPPPK